MDLSEMNEQVKKAFEFASFYHQGQKRKGSKEAYIVHPYRVWKVVKEYSKNDEVLECAALLHDIVEDSEVTIEDIKTQFGVLTAKIVAEVSLSKEDKKNLTWVQKKAKTISNVAKLSTYGQLVELADKYSNALDLPKLRDEAGNLNFQNFHETNIKQQEWYYRSLYEAFKKSAKLASVRLLVDKFCSVIDFGFGRSYNDYLMDEESQMIKEKNMNLCEEKNTKEGPLFIEVMGTPGSYSSQLVDDIVDMLVKRNLSVSVVQCDMDGLRAFEAVKKLRDIKDNSHDDVVLLDCALVQEYIGLLLRCEREIKKDPACVYDIVEDLNILREGTAELLSGVIGIYAENEPVASKSLKNTLIDHDARELYNAQFYESLNVCAENVPSLPLFEPTSEGETSILVEKSVQLITSQLGNTKKKPFIKTISSSVS